MDVSTKGLHFIARREALVLVAYPDGRFNSIGCGHNGAHVHDGMEVTIPRAFELLKQDCASRKPEIVRYLDKAGVDPATLSQNQWDALVSFYHQRSNRNHGFQYICGRIKGPPEALKAGWLIYDDNSKGVPMPGLYKRRCLEWSVWEDAEYEPLYDDVSGTLGEGVKQTLNPVPVWRAAPSKTKAEPYEVTEADLVTAEHTLS